MNSQTDRLTTALAGRYRIERHLGAGGMATVYLAEDLKHDRKVALKVLKPELAAVLGAERFVVEIKTTASLQHPHILPLFDSGTADGFLYYVMPFIEGETLRDKLNRETQLGVEEAVRITREVADALDYAHRRGVIHRDIKPENILLHDQRPMVADFGIALAVSAAAGGRMTETGLSLGTPHYMSPEQATADKEITGRSDVYSLASVLYEMLTGNPPHVGSSAQQIIMKIIAEPAQPVTALRKSVPPNVAAALARALEKLPADRFGSAKEFAEALQNSSFTSARIDASSVATRAPASRSTALVAIGIAVLATVLGAWGWLRPRPESPVQIIRYVDAPLGDSLLTTPRKDFAMSPDGSRIAFLGGATPLQSHLLVRERNQLLATRIPGSDRAAGVFFAPDSRRLAFFTITGPQVFQIKAASLDGGPPKTIAERVSSFSSLWEADGFVYVQRVGAPILSRVREGGGEIMPFTTLDSAAGENLHRTPKSMYDGRRLLFIAVTADSGSVVAIADLSSGSHRRTGIKASIAWYATSGHLLYQGESGALMSVPFDSKREVVTGDPEIVVEGFVPGGALDVDLSRSGTLMYLASERLNQPDELLWLNRDGTPIPSQPWTADFADLALAPDGKQLVVGIRQRGIVELWVHHLETGSRSRLTFETDGSATEPAWTPDGSAVAYIQKGSELYRRRADGSTPAEQLTPRVGDYDDLAWTPDGHLLVEIGTAGSRDVISLKPGPDTTTRPVLTTRSNEQSATVSPDGRWVAYTTNESGRFEVFVRPLANPSAERAQVSTEGGQSPLWSSTGRELYFVKPGAAAPGDDVSGGSTMTVVDVRAEPRFRVSAPREVFKHNRFINYWAMTPDGKRFVIVAPAAQRRTGARSDVVIVENWTHELKKASRSGPAKQ